MRIKRNYAIVSTISFVCIVAFFVLQKDSNENILTRIMEDINSQGCSTLSSASQVKAKARYAEIIDGKLVLYGGDTPNSNELVHVDLWVDDAGPYDVCTAKTVVIEHAFDSKPCLEMTFHDLAYLPPFMTGPSKYIPLERDSRLGRTLYSFRVRLWYLKHY